MCNDSDSVLNRQWDRLGRGSKKEEFVAVMLSVWVWEAAQGEAFHRASLEQKQGGERNTGGVGSVLGVKATGKELQEKRESGVGSHGGR